MDAAAADNAPAEAIGERDRRKKALLLRLGQLLSLSGALFAGTHYADGLPKMPPLGTDEANFLAPLTDAADRWRRINTDAQAKVISNFAGPLLLAEGYTLAQFETDIAALRSACRAHDMATSDAEDRLRRRDALLPALRERFNQYRKIARALIPEGHPLLATLPALSPPRRAPKKEDGGATPPPAKP